MEGKGQFEITQGGPELTCSEFDALLTDALDGVLSQAAQRRFESHKAQCATCGPMFSEVAAGMNWLNSLAEVEPPANLVHNVLAATNLQTSAALAAAPKRSWKARLSEVASDLAVPFRGLVRDPRLAMTVAMALFSITLSLNLAGVRLSDLKHVDLRPSAIRETATMKYTETTNRVIHYYNSIRLVYEVESRLQELKRATSSTEDQPQPRQDRNKTENEKKERKQNYYSTEGGDSATAGLLAQWSADELKYCSVREQCQGTGRDVAGNSINTEDFSMTGLPRFVSTARNSEWAASRIRPLPQTVLTETNRSEQA